MKIVSLSIGHWRNFRDIELAPAPDSTLVCLTGDNGTGKSNILELLAAAAAQLGLAPSVVQRRGDLDTEPHAYSVTLQLTEPPEAYLGVERWGELEAQGGTGWDRTITFKSERAGDSSASELMGGGLEDVDLSRQVANEVAQALKRRQEVGIVYLDADRAYPPIPLSSQQYAEALERPWGAPDQEKKWATQLARTLYEEWLKYWLGREGKAATAMFRDLRRAREAGTPPPEFEDPFPGYKDWLKAVLPHLSFVGVDLDARTVLFDTAGVELEFAKLSGGEREIAFIVGQIERFHLRRGLLLVDEPELHLNPDLLRNWLSFLRDTIEDGQVWAATHALEAAEVAGRDSTFVLEREPDTRVVTRASTLRNRPVLSALATAVGAPAFSLYRRRFIYIEGDRQTGERERFFRICGNAEANRFIEGGSAEEVVRHLASVSDLADETEEQLHVGGVVDRDFRTVADMSELRQRAPVYVLECLEVENLFLHPDNIAALLNLAGEDPTIARDVIQMASDRFAGMWILQRAAFRNNLYPCSEARAHLYNLAWEAIVDPPRLVDDVMDLCDDWGAPGADVTAALLDSIERYRSTRENPELWKRCLGKQALSAIPEAIGLANPDALVGYVARLWDSGESPVPIEVQHLREYVEGIGV